MFMKFLEWYFIIKQTLTRAEDTGINIGYSIVY